MKKMKILQVVLLSLSLAFVFFTIGAMYKWYMEDNSAIKNKFKRLTIELGSLTVFWSLSYLIMFIF